MSVRERAIYSFSAHPPELLEYDTTQQQFTIGSETVALADHAMYVSPVPEVISIEAAAQILESPNMHINVLDRVLIFPKLTTWMKSLSAPELDGLKTNVVDAMVDSYVTLTGQDEVAQFRDESHMDFNMSLIRPGQPDMSVFGNCACLGVTAEAHIFKQNSWSEGFAEMEFHNIDLSAQKTALLVGVGVISRTCRLQLSEEVLF